MKDRDNKALQGVASYLAEQHLDQAVYQGILPIAHATQDAKEYLEDYYYQEGKRELEAAEQERPSISFTWTKEDPEEVITSGMKVYLRVLQEVRDAFAKIEEEGGEEE